MYKQTTCVPNFLLDTWLPKLTESELKIILVIIRQTIGWVDLRTGQRKIRDRISILQFRQKTGLSKRGITIGIQSLVNKGLVTVTDYEGTILPRSKNRKGKSYLYFSFLQPAHLTTLTSAQNIPELAQKTYHNKTKRTKINKTKESAEFAGHISAVLLQKHET